MEDKTRADLLATMVQIRVFEEAILADYHADKKPAWDIGAGLIPGEMHLSAGQEPVAAGVCAHLDNRDAVTAAAGPRLPPRRIEAIQAARSLRLAAQDVALSRRKQGFESPRERQ